MKIWTRRQNLTTIVVGAYLSFSPYIFGMSWETTSTANAAIVGILLIEVALWHMVVDGSKGAGRAKVALGCWLLVAPLVLSFASLAATLSAWIAGLLLLASADTARIAREVASALQANYLRYQTRTITPENITKFSSPQRLVGPDQLARQIVESSHQIRRTLLEEPPDLVVEMCALGYSESAENMIALVKLVDAELAKAGLLRRLRLRATLRRAADALSLARQATPPDVVSVTPRKRLC